MTNKLLDASIKTMIGQLPSIINYNNDMIEREFDGIVDSSTHKMKLDVQANNVNATTGSFSNLIVNNVQLDASTLEQYKVLYNEVNDISTRLAGINPETATLFGASYVNEKLNIQSDDEVDMSVFFDETDFRKAIV